VDYGVWGHPAGLGHHGHGHGLHHAGDDGRVLLAASAHTSGLASGILNAARQVGGTLGVALMGTLVRGQHAQGFRWAFGLTLAAYLLMAGFTLWLRHTEE